MFSGFGIHLVGSALLFIAIVLASIGFSVWSYRTTNPPVSKGLRRFLLTLRSIAVVLVIIMLFEPLISLTWQRTEQPIVALLMDTSASMGLKDKGGDREIQAEQAFTDVNTFLSKQDVDIESFQFSDQLNTASIDSLQFNHDGTDITGALTRLTERMSAHYLAGVVLISDGNYNLGENPIYRASTYPAPIYTVAVGDPYEQQDALIAKIATNQIAYANTTVPVEVTVRAYGYAGKKITVELKQGTQVLDSKHVELGDNSMESRVRLQYTPKEPGDMKYSISIPALAGELTTANNIKEFYVNVLKSKMQIMIMAGGPGYDYEFIKNALSGDANVNVAHWVQKSSAEFYEGKFPSNPASFKNVDCFIWIDFPRRDTPPQALSVLNDVIRSQNKPLFLISGPSLYWPGLKPLEGYLPVSIQDRTLSERLVILQLTATGEQHPIMRLDDELSENQLKWRELPPIYLERIPNTLVPGSDVLLTVNKIQSKLQNYQDNIPLLVARKMADRKTVTMLGYGIWRWGFLMQGLGKYTDAFPQFLMNTVRWLITNEDSKLVRIRADKPIYRNGEKITFTAETYYEDYTPLDGADVRVTVKGNGEQYEIVLTGSGSGTYEGEFHVLAGGDYTFEGTATYQDKELGTDSGKFSVEPFRLEYADTRMNETLLKQIADRSGGAYVTTNNITELDSVMQLSRRTVTESRQWEIWHQWYMLVGVIVLLSVEWFIRKRTGML
ncbi:hypothetical protein JW960_12545 [candidate division KSB1 bacterium]|nr:hypothetical protein [candidate division KSB1 bacterium]